MNAPVIRTIALTLGYQPLASARTVGNFLFRAPASGAAFLLSDDGVSEVPLDRSQEFTMNGVDLAQIKVRTTSLGDDFIVIGATRTL